MPKQPHRDPTSLGPQHPRTPGPRDPRTPVPQDPGTPGPRYPRTPVPQERRWGPGVLGSWGPWGPGVLGSRGPGVLGSQRCRPLDSTPVSRWQPWDAWTSAASVTMDTLGIEPRAPRMLSGCDATTPRALGSQQLPSSVLLRRHCSCPWSPRTPGPQDPRTPGPQDPRTPVPQDPGTPARRWGPGLGSWGPWGPGVLGSRGPGVLGSQRCRPLDNTPVSRWQPWDAWTSAASVTMDTLGIEPRAPRMLSGCDTTTPRALGSQQLPSSVLLRRHCSCPWSPRTPGPQDPRTPGPQDPRTPVPQDPGTPARRWGPGTGVLGSLGSWGPGVPGSWGPGVPEVPAPGQHAGLQVAAMGRLDVRLHL